MKLKEIIKTVAVCILTVSLTCLCVVYYRGGYEPNLLH